MIKKILEDIATLEKEEVAQENKKEFVPVLNQAFKNWFADSKVVDDNGQPLVCYHGSTVDIEEFDLGYSGSTTGNNQEQVFYFTSDKDTAITYSQQATVRENEWKFYDEETGFESWEDYKQYLEDEVFENPHINPCYLYIKNPYIIDMNYENFDAKKNYTIISFLKGNTNIDSDLWDDGIAEELYQEFSEYDEENDEWITKDVDYDGVIIKNVIDNIDERNQDYIDVYIVWDPYQIKSIYNKGIWSNSSANVMESVNEMKLSQSTREYIDSLKSKNPYVLFKDEAPYTSNPWSETGYITLDGETWMFYSREKCSKSMGFDPAWGLINEKDEIIWLKSSELDLLLGQNGEKLQESFNEKFEELEENIFATNSAYDVLNVIKNKPKPYRLIYDRNIHQYFIGDAYNYIHQDLLEAGFRSGFYPDLFSEGEVRDYLEDNLFNGEILFFAFYPDENKRLDVEKSSDGYSRKYVYDFGTIYSHEMSPLEDFDIYKLLGEPIKKEDIFESLDINDINESIIKYLK